MGLLFGTDGVRGVANSELTPLLAYKIGKAGAAVLSKETDNPTFVIGMDTRLSGDLLENALSAGILAVGGNVIKVGVIPTPAIAYLTRYFEAEAGVVISASHNPFEYNGIKFFNRNGFKLDDFIEEEIESLIIREIETNRYETGENVGKCLEADESADTLYSRFLLDTTEGLRLDGMKVVLDCANGAAYRVAPKVYEALGAKVVVIGDAPDGKNINKDAGSTHPEKLQRRVLDEQADIGLAFDGDADRLIVVDEKGNVVDGDRTICICAKYLKERRKLSGNLVTATVMSNLGFHKYVNEKLDAKVVTTKVGDRYVLESMLETGCVIGGEQSGHIIFLEYTTTGDGILSSLQFLKAVVSSGREVSELAEEIKIYPQVLVNARVANENKKTFMNDEEVKAIIAKAEEDLADTGRVLIRPSGTEPVVRVMLEGEDINFLHKTAEDIAALISRKYA